jgi:hypothetical protein
MITADGAPSYAFQILKTFTFMQIFKVQNQSSFVCLFFFFFAFFSHLKTSNVLLVFPLDDSFDMAHLT